jgi:predicted AlkP superfamily pyrophosphatase or phosphodiesterase
MNHGRRCALLVLLLLLLGGGCSAQQEEAPRPILDLAPTVVLISLDGMRADYPEMAAMPNLQRLMQGGVRGELIPVFPTLTFPGHYSMVTGLHPGNHGIVGNHMHDAELGRYSMGDASAVTDGRWYGGEPIWVTAVKQGQRAGTCFWVGSEAEIAGHRPTRFRRFDGSLSGEQRLDCLFAGLDLPRAQRPTFFTLYFSDADWAGHRHGPGSPQMAAALERLDAVLGKLITGLEQRGLLTRVNLVIVSDHGMADSPAEKAIVLDDLLDAARMRDADILHLGPLLGLRSRSGDDEGLYRALAAVHDATFRVYRREETPEHWRFRRHPRIPPVVALAGEGHMFTTRERMARGDWPRGMHGYDNRLDSMRALFVAHGPAFRRGARAPAFETVHLYELMCHILGLEPAPNDGELKAVRELLASGP